MSHEQREFQAAVAVFWNNPDVYGRLQELQMGWKSGGVISNVTWLCNKRDWEIWEFLRDSGEESGGIVPALRQSPIPAGFRESSLRWHLSRDEAIPRVQPQDQALCGEPYGGPVRGFWIFGISPASCPDLPFLFGLGVVFSCEILLLPALARERSRLHSKCCTTLPAISRPVLEAFVKIPAHKGSTLLFLSHGCWWKM